MAMNFFEHQERARTGTSRLVVLFTLATVLTVLAVMAVVGGVILANSGEALRREGAGGVLADAAPVLALVGGGTMLLILFGSLTRTASLRAGGGAVARSLGGIPLPDDPRDPLSRRLRNVVEEMAIASGVPAPEIYVLDKEPGINAFAAGFSPGDAAIGVTRGTLEKLNRDELQGVIAHEFSHILNGDMRLNMKLMGVLYGIMLLGLIGQSVLRGSMYSGAFRSRGRDRNSGGGAILLIGLGVMIVGFVGVFFGELIKAGVSRKREYLADASAVQFTRNPAGIAGALKKIAGYGSKLNHPKAEEVSHMLLGPGTGLSRMFATHPPILDRIRAIEPDFDPRELERMDETHGPGHEAAAAFAGSAPPPPPPGKGRRAPLDPAEAVARAGTAGPAGLAAASLTLGSLPEVLRAGAAHPRTAPAVVASLLLDDDPASLTRQRAALDEIGAQFRTDVEGFARETAGVPPRRRLALVDIALPALRRRSPEEAERFLDLVDRLTVTDGRIDLFEYALSRLLRTHLEDAFGPPRSDGSARLGDRRDEAEVLLAVVAVAGQTSVSDAGDALDRGLAALGLERSGRTLPPDDWVRALDASLLRLDRLAPREKARLLEGLVAVITHDGTVVAEEWELLRVTAEMLHVPLPVVPGDAA